MKSSLSYSRVQANCLASQSLMSQSKLHLNAQVEYSLTYPDKVKPIKQIALNAGYPDCRVCLWLESKQFTDQAHNLIPTCQLQQKQIVRQMKPGAESEFLN